MQHAHFAVKLLPTYPVFVVPDNATSTLCSQDFANLSLIQVSFTCGAEKGNLPTYTTSTLCGQAFANFSLYLLFVVLKKTICRHTQAHTAGKLSLTYPLFAVLKLKKKIC